MNDPVENGITFPHVSEVAGALENMIECARYEFSISCTACDDGKCRCHRNRETLAEAKLVLLRYKDAKRRTDQWFRDCMCLTTRRGGCRMSDMVSVADITPFWRYAVGPTRPHSPAVPFWTRKGADAFFAEVQRDLPWAGAVLYRRVWWRGITVVSTYNPMAGGAA